MVINDFRIGIAGIGKMGALHAKICSGIPGVVVSGVCDTGETKALTAASLYGCRHCTDYRDLASMSDAVIVAVPTARHREVGSFFLERGIPVLIEKPLAATSADAQALVDTARENGTILQVGHIERFNPAVAAVSDMIGEPKFIDCSRVSPFPFRSTDVCVVLDLMIHDIDIILYLARSKVRSLSAVGVKVLTSAEDIANARIVFENGCVADVTASRVSVKRERQIRIFQTDSYISLDYEENKAKIFTRRPGAEDIDVSALNPAEVGDPLEYVLRNLIDTRDIPVEQYNPLEKELLSFVNCIENGGIPVVTGEQGRDAIAVAEAIRKEILVRLEEK